ncbi:hypothetical protein PanWU01x14_233190 [Parasponia andersonii]|uniref:Uncharacterized protein n=1 Tax=Parasponia andersonii TaxID=3476 RepID=A0A2P5BJV5_PARAD|nr:hypothetical protein PanWU01x14_233190 [Parasponia andersonii]
MVETWTSGGNEWGRSVRDLGQNGPTKTWDPDQTRAGPPPPLLSEAHGHFYVFGSALLNQSTIKSNYMSRTV